MKQILVMSLVALLMISSLATVGWSQVENLSAGRGFGLGVRFLPQALVPTAPSDIDPALGSAIVVQYWFNDTMGAEVGGWASGFTDDMNPHSSFMTISGGLLYRLSDNAQLDAYAAARAITMQRVSTNCCIVYEPPPPSAAPKAGSALQNDAIVPPWPGPSSESHSSTLAVELALGIEQSWSYQVTTDFEAGLIYGQTMRTNNPIPGTAQPVPISPLETSAASSFGIMLQVSLNFYLPRR